MSWYNNNNESTFIDATQTLTGGGGAGGGTGDIVINEGSESDNLGFDSTISDFIQLKFENNLFNLYLNNKNQGGLIYINTSGADNKIKIENGKLYLYYDYNPIISLIIPSGFTDVIDYIISNRQGVNNNLAAIAGLTSTVVSIQSELTLTVVAVTTLTAQVQQHEARLNRLDHGIEVDNIATEATRNIAQKVKDAIESMIIVWSSRALPISNFRDLLTYLGTKQGLIFGIITAIGVGGTISALIQIVEYLADYFREDEELNNIKTLFKSADALQTNSDRNTLDKIYIDGLQIVANTNLGGLTDAEYTVAIDSDVDIVIKVTSGIAEILRLEGSKGGYQVNDTISINKSEIGGTTGTLDITVTQVYSLVQIIDLELLKSGQNLQDIQNRNRRRQFIPDKNSFSTDGINITETNITEPSGEITKNLNIALKTDSQHFTYDANGNLQLINYADIATNSTAITNIQNEIGSNTTTPKTGIYLLIENVDSKADGNATKITTLTNNLSSLTTTVNTNTNSISNNQSAITALQTSVNNNATAISNNAGNISTNTANITANTNAISSLTSGGNLANVWELILPETYNYNTNPNDVMSLGYKNNYAINLITLASKTTPTTINEADYQNDILGLIPTLDRVKDSTEISVLKTENLNVNTDFSFEKGLIYFNNIGTNTYDLNRTFELVCFIRPADITSLTEKYYILQTGKPNPLGTNYTIDDNKLKIYIKDNNLYISHLVLYKYLYYAINSADILVSNVINNFSSATFTSNTTTGLSSIFIDVSSSEQYRYEINNQNSNRALADINEVVDTARVNTGNFIMNFFQNYTGYNSNDNSSLTYYTSPFIRFARTAGTIPGNMGKITIRYEIEYFDRNLIPPNLFTLSNHTGFNVQAGITELYDYAPPDSVDWRRPRFVISITRVNGIGTASILGENLGSTVGGTFETGDIIEVDPQYVFPRPPNTYTYVQPNVNPLTLTAQTLFPNWDNAFYDSQADFDNNLEFRFVISTFNSSGIPVATQSQELVYNGHTNYLYEQTIDINNVSPYYAGTTKYPDVRLALEIHNTGTTFGNPSGRDTNDYYFQQHRLIIKGIDIIDYASSTTLATGHAIREYTDGNVLIPSINASEYYKLIIQANLQTRDLTYYLDNTSTTLTIPSNGNIDIIPQPNEDPSVTNRNAISLIYATDGQTSITDTNEILIIGNEPTTGQLDFINFNWRFLQTGDNPLSSLEIQKLDELKLKRFYTDDILIDRFLKVKELSADVIEAKKTIYNNTNIYNQITPADQLSQLPINQGINQNVLSANFWIPINKLYTDATLNQDALLYFNSTTREVSLNTNFVNVNTINNIQSDITALQTSVNTNSTNITQNEQNISTNVTNISTNSSAISTLQSDLTNLTSSVNTNSGNITTLQNDLTSLTSSVNTNTGNITNLTNSVNTLTTTTSTNANNISTNSTAITNLTSTVNANITAISGLQSDVSINSARITGNDGDISTLFTLNNANQTNITTNTNNISTNTTAISALQSPPRLSTGLTFVQFFTFSNTFAKANVFSSSTTPITINNITIDYTNHRIDINTTGIYQISYNFNFTSKRSARVIVRSVLYVNGVELAGTENKNSYLRFFNYTASNSMSMIANLSSGDYIEVYFAAFGDTPTGGQHHQLNGAISNISLFKIA